MAFWRSRKRDDRGTKPRVSRSDASPRGGASGRDRQTKSLGSMVDLLETTLAEGAGARKNVSRKR